MFNFAGFDPNIHVIATVEEVIVAEIVAIGESRFAPLYLDKEHNLRPGAVFELVVIHHAMSHENCTRRDALSLLRHVSRGSSLRNEAEKKVLADFSSSTQVVQEFECARRVFQLLIGRTAH